MSKSSPADLAVAFRSLARRSSDAAGPESPPELITATNAAVDRAIQAAAALLGTTTTAVGVAATIEARRAQDWTERDLDALREQAFAAAAAIRTLQDSAHRD